MTHENDDELIVRTSGAVGHITLNRPKAINALTIGMIRGIEAALTEWESDDSIRIILLDGAGERGFCAGGDIKKLWESAKESGADGSSFGETYWREEYELDARIANYSKPVVAIMDGLVMGGGVGLAGHATVRVATERLKLAMPEVGIGFTPDVGGTWILANAPGELGTHMALTGGIIGAHDALLTGFAGVVIDSTKLDQFTDLLSAGDYFAALAAVGAASGADLEQSKLAKNREWIDAAYNHDTVEEIVAALKARPEEAAQKTAEEILTKSPTSLKVALHNVREAAKLSSLEEAFDLEFRAACRFLTPDGDFVEGVRAALIDKDRNPQWNPANLADVSDETVAAYFAPLSHIPELGLANRPKSGVSA